MNKPHASFWFTLAFTLTILLGVTSSLPSYGAETVDAEPVNAGFRWGECKRFRWGCGGYDMPTQYERDPLCRYIKWRCTGK